MMSEFINKVAEMAQVPAPRAVSLGIAKAQTIRYGLFKSDPPRISETTIGVVSAGQYLDGSKAEQELGFKPTVSLDETIKRTLTWFKENGYI